MVPGSLIPVLFSMELAADEFLFVIVTVISVAPSPSGGLFATGSGDMRARIWRSVPFVVYISPQFSFLFSPPGPDRIILFLSRYFLFLISFFSRPTLPHKTGVPGLKPPRMVFHVSNFGVA